ncbi:MAG: hypothetical protein KGI27_12960 [Thaumarchaeota archaeon]|nr:hypothetical protein [Nitrososphaerota archaeon]
MEEKIKKTFLLSQTLKDVLGEKDTQKELASEIISALIRNVAILVWQETKDGFSLSQVLKMVDFLKEDILSGNQTPYDEMIRKVKEEE